MKVNYGHVGAPFNTLTTAQLKARAVNLRTKIRQSDDAIRSHAVRQERLRAELAEVEALRQLKQ